MAAECRPREADLDTDATRPRRPKTIGRTLFQILILGILVPSALIWAFGRVAAHAAVTFLWDGLAHQIADNTIERTLRYLETGETALDYNASLVAMGATDPNDRRAMLRYLVAGLRANPNVTWYSFAGEDGAYLSAYHKSDGTTRVTWREQEAEGARYRDFVVEADGTWRALPEHVKVYDPRTRDWYIATRAAGHAVWSDPFLFASGPPGFILSSPAMDADGGLIGVWGIEYEMAYVSEFLSRLEIGRTGRAYLVTAAGEVIGHPNVGADIGAPDGWIVVERDGTKEIALADAHRDDWLRHAFAFSPTGDADEANGSFEIDGDVHLTAVRRFPPESGLDWRVVVVVPEEDILGTVHRYQLYAALAALVIAAVFLVLGQVHARSRLSGPLTAVARDLRDMARLETETAPRIESSGIDEVAGMIAARETMRRGLRSFKRYVPADLVQELMERGIEAELGGEERVLTTMFSDIAGFTHVSEQIGDPATLVAALGDYLHVMSKAIADQEGTLDKYIGDAVMAFWGAPRRIPDHALRACEAAWASQAALRERRVRWRAEGRPLFHARIGVNTGRALVGNIGSPERMNYTVMGDTVNLASRLEGLCAIYAVDVAIGPTTAEAVRDRFTVRPVDCVEVKGKREAVVFYELMGPVDAVSDERARFSEAYTDAFARYLARDFEAARRGFAAATEVDLGDVSARILLARCEQYVREPPPDDWTGATRLERKH